MRRLAWIAWSVLAGLSAACAGPRTVLIASEPAGASIAVDGKSVGTSPVEHAISFAGRDLVVVTATHEGFYDAMVVLKKGSPGLSEGKIQIPMRADEVAVASAPSDAANEWVYVRLNPGVTLDGALTRVAEGAKKRYGTVQVQDPTTGYVQSAPSTRTFQTPTMGAVEVRTQLVGAVVTATPLTYRMMIVTEWRRLRGGWQPYGRVFKEDAELLEELVKMLGTKEAKPS